MAFAESVAFTWNRWADDLYGQLEPVVADFDGQGSSYEMEAEVVQAGLQSCSDGHARVLVATMNRSTAAEGSQLAVIEVDLDDERGQWVGSRATVVDQIAVGDDENPRQPAPEVSCDGADGVAREVVEAVFSFDPRSADADAERAKSLLTGSALEDYDANTERVRAVQKDNPAPASVRVLSSGVGECSAGTAEILMVFVWDQPYGDAPGMTQQFTTSLGMVREGDAWKAESIEWVG